MGTILGKVWGTTVCLLKTPLIEVHRLEILPNAQCSMHLHRTKWNCFVVLQGTLSILVEREAYKLTDETVLGPGDLTTVQPGENHRFRSGNEPVVALEIYYPETLSEDIVRKDVGSLVAAPSG